ncbi:hypothetical protein M9458_050114, partial [Cirrhinus mrigala]
MQHCVERMETTETLPISSSVPHLGLDSLHSPKNQDLKRMFDKIPIDRRPFLLQFCIPK